LLCVVVIVVVAVAVAVVAAALVCPLAGMAQAARSGLCNVLCQLAGRKQGKQTQTNCVLSSHFGANASILLVPLVVWHAGILHLTKKARVGTLNAAPCFLVHLPGMEPEFGYILLRFERKFPH